MEKQALSLNSVVTDYLDEQNHPFRMEIEQLRNCILSADTALTENIKWNSPNYCFDNEDSITMRIQPPTKQIPLIFLEEQKSKNNQKIN